MLAGVATNGQQIGTSNNQATGIVFESGIFVGPAGETSINKVILTVKGASSSTTATINCTIGGVAAGTAQAIDNDNAVHAFAFTPASGTTGKIVFTFSGIAKGIFIQSLEVFADAGASGDNEKAAAYAHKVEMASACNAATEYAALASARTALGDTAGAIADAMMIDDIKTTGSNVAVRGACTVAAKMAFMKGLVDAGSPAVNFLKDENGSNGLAVALISVSSLLLAGGALLLIKKKKHA